MNDTATEYLKGNGSNGNGHSNGHANGNGNGKIFDLVKAQDPLAVVVPQARRKVCQNTHISTGSRMLFCYITDASLTAGLSTRKGVVKFSDSDLAHRFAVNVKTIRNWKNEIKSTGEIWLTEKFMKNTFPQTVYNVACIVGNQPMLPNIESQDGSLPEDEVFSSNRRRQRLVFHDPVTGKFARRNTPPPVRPAVSQEESLEKTEENAPSENFLPPTTAIECRPPRQNIAADNGKNLPSPTAKNCRPVRKAFAALDGKKLPLSTANDCRSPRQPIADNVETKDVSRRVSERSFKRSTGFNALNRPGEAEKAFLSDVDEVMEAWKPGHSKKESTGSGAWWRLAYRIDAELIGRVLAEVRVMVNERTIKFNPGSTAVDLWTRWGGGKVCNERAVSVPKQKAAGRAAAR